MKSTFRGGVAIGSLGLTLVLTAHAAPPVISYQPRDQNVVLYQQASFGVIADGTPPFSYQWLKDGAPITGATNDRLIFAHAQFSDEGCYTVLVSNSEPGFATSTNARLVVKLPQAGDIDGTFASGNSINGQILSIAIQPNGKIVIAGDFTNVNGAVRGRIARLTPDGTLDFPFMDGQSGASGAVYSVALQPDGKMIIGGEFTNVNGIVRNNIARLNADGSLDETFQNGLSGVAGVGYDTTVYAVGVQQDGKILIAGSFTNVNGVACSNIARLNSNGTLDGSFQSTLPGLILSMLIQPNGKIVVSGGLSNAVVRLNPNGTLDTLWDMSPLLQNGGVHSLALESDGSIVIGGNYSAYHENPHMVVTRLYAGGGYQTNSFERILSLGGTVYSVGVQVDGKILVGGVMGSDGIALVRFNQDGTWDKDLREDSLGLSAVIFAMASQQNGKMLVGGWIFGARSSIARLNEDGTLDDGFQSSTSVTDGSVNSVSVQPDNKLVIGGNFAAVHGVARYGVARLNPDGTLDPTFQTVSVNPVEATALQNDGKVLVGHFLYYVNSAIHPGIARLNTDGTLDNNFQTSVLDYFGNAGTVHSIIVLPDDKILIGGSFSTVNGVAHTNIARLNTDGTLDGAFQTQVEGVAINQIAVQDDGKLLVAGAFSTVNGVDRQHFARLNPEGSLDETFAPPVFGGSGPDIVLQSDGKIIAGQYRLNPDGSIDDSFHYAGTGGWLLLRNDGKIIEGDNNHIIQLNSDGSIDSSFRSDQVGIPLALQSGNKILIGGVLRRLFGSDFPPMLKNPSLTGNDANLSWHAISNRTYRVEYRGNLSTGDWQDLSGDVCATNDLAGKTDVTASTANQRYYRLQQLP